MKLCGKQECNTDVIHTCILKRVMISLSKAILFSLFIWKNYMAEGNGDDKTFYLNLTISLCNARHHGQLRVRCCTQQIADKCLCLLREITPISNGMRKP